MLGIMRRQCGRRNLAAVVGSFPIYTAFLDSVKLTGAFLAADPSLDTKRVPSEFRINASADMLTNSQSAPIQAIRQHRLKS